jgi:hypothetical protein
MDRDSPSVFSFYIGESKMQKFEKKSSAMVSVLTSSVVYCGFEPRSGQTKDCKIGICYFSGKHASFRRKSKDWLARNQDNVSDWTFPYIFIQS